MNMQRLAIILFVVLPGAIEVTAQVTDSKKAITFSSINSIGLINGSKNEALAVETINGIKKDKWFAGAGVGIDYYFYRTAPLFIAIQREVLSRKNTPFMYADYGLNLPLLTDDQKNLKGQTGYTKGVYYDIGIGWKLKGNKNRALDFSVGYSYKQIKEEVTLMWWGPGPVIETPAEKYDNRLTRLMIKIGVQL
jgi:hypothetical protein